MSGSARSAPSSSALTTDASSPLPLTRESPIPGVVPRYGLADWRERWGIVAGITGRGDGPVPGFDLGLWTREPVGEVMERWLLFRRAEAGFDRFVLGHQVHGASIAWHVRGAGWTWLEGLDGHLTRDAGVLLLITVADCVPVYMAVPGKAVGLLHAGWRGTAAGILPRGIALIATGADVAPSEIVMHLGVSICGSCYEVGSEVMMACGVATEGPGPWHLDLRRLLADQARCAGVGEITVSAWCSAHDRSRFYSHRASGGRDGRMVAFVGMPAD
jgi:YfiH family protein